MTSAERHELRYQRRKTAREAKRLDKVKDALDYDKVFSFQNLYRSAQECFRGVSWKASVQAYKARCGINVAGRYRALKNGQFKMKKCQEFEIRERGHLRHINSIHIDDRVPQKCNSKYALKPVLHRGLLYDNYASQEDKGTTLARERLECQLQRHIRRHGMTGGILILDVHHFFDSIQHSLVQKILEQNFTTDARITDFNMRIVRHCRNDNVGLVLGSENSQDFAIATPNSLDHYIKEVLGVESYGRYMDDICITHDSFEKLKGFYTKINAFAASLGFKLNEKKSRLLHFGKPFSMLKRKYSFIPTGHIIIQPARASVIRERRKIKKLHKKFLAGRIPFHAVVESLNSWKSSIDGTCCYKVMQSINKLFDQLFIYPWLAGKEQRKPCITKSYQMAR